MLEMSLTCRTGPLGPQLDTLPAGGREDVALEAAALGPPAGGVVGEVLTLATRSGRLLLEALVEGGPVVGLPLLPAVTPGPALLWVQVEELAPLAGSLGELPVAPLVRGPPVPVVEPLAVLLLLTEPSGPLLPLLALPEDEPLPEAAGSPGVGLVALALGGEGVAGQTPALGLEGVHGPHEARSARVALLHVGAGPGGVELVAGPVLLVEDESLLALALRGLCGVVEGEVVAGWTGSSRVELVALQNRSTGRTSREQLLRSKKCVKEMQLVPEFSVPD